MKTNLIKIISVIMCLATIFTVTALTRTRIYGASSDTVLFYNDRAWTLSSRLPAEQVHSVYYVPISFLVQLPSVEVRMNESLGTFIITHGDLFLSFDTTTDFAANQDKERTYIKTAEYHSERYVPARTVCAYLNLGYEELSNSVTGVTAIRITDGNQQTPLAELARSKYPTLFPVEPETGNQGSDSSGTSDSSQNDTDRTPLSERTIYITVELNGGNYVSSILSALKRYGYKATFFVSEDNIANNAAMLSKICAGGNEIGLILGNSGSDTDTDTLLANISTQNKKLYRLIKKESRIWRFADENVPSDNRQAELSAALFEKGYVLWDGTDIAATGTPTAQSDAAIDMIKKDTSLTLCFKEGRNTADTLRRVLEFIRNNRTSCDVRIASPAFYNDYIG